MKSKRLYRQVMGSILMLVCVTTAFAQLNAGSITGRIVDPKGNGVDAAQITLENQSTGSLFHAVTGIRGEFRIENVPEGRYSVTVRADGFATLTSQEINIQTGRPAQFNRALSLPLPSGQLAGEVTALEQRVKDLESRNRELASQNQAIMQLLKEMKAKLDGPPQVATANATAAAPSDANLIALSRPAATAALAAKESRPSSDSSGAASSTATNGSSGDKKAATNAPSQDHHDDRWSIAIGENNKFQLYGQLRLDMIVDSQRPNNAQSPLFIPSPDPLAGGKPGAGSFAMHPRLTTFGIDYSGPEVGALGDGRLSGKLEMDFQNGGAEFQQAIRILQAYFKINWGDFYVLGGQKWDTFSPIRPIVNDDSVMLAAGNVGIRRPQLLAGYEPKIGEGRLSIVGGIGLTGAVDSQDLDGNGFLDGQKSGRPNIQARIGYSHPLWVDGQPAIIGLSGVYGFLNTDNPVVGRTSFREQLVNADYVLPIAKFLTLRGEGWWGRDLSDLVGGVGQGINLLTGQEIRSRGGWSELNIKVSRYYSFNPGFTIDDPVDGDIPGGGRTRNRTFYIGNRIIPSENFLIGFDYLRWRTDFKGFAKGIDNRVNIFFAYHF